MLTKRFRGVSVGPDMLLGILLQSLNAATAFGLMLILARTLPKEEFGLYSLALAPMVIATGFADFGIVATLMPRMAVAGSLPNPAFRTGLLLRLLLIVVAWVGMNLYLLAVVADSRFLLIVNLGYLAILFSSKLTGLRQIFEMLWRLKGRGYGVSLFALVDGLLILAGVLLVSWKGTLNPERVMLIILLGSIPGCLAIVFPVMLRLRGQGLWVKAPKRYFLGVVRASLPIALFGTVAQMQGQIETLVVGHFGNLQQIAAISVPIRVLQGTLFMATIASFTLAPVIAQIYKRRRRDLSIEQIVSVAVRLIGSVGLGITLFCVLFAPQIMMIFGNEYAADAELLRLYSFANALTFLVVTFDQVLMAIGSRTKVLYGVVIGLVASLLLEVIAVVSVGSLESIIVAKICSIAFLVLLQTLFLPISIRRAAQQALMRIGAVMSVLAISVWLIPTDQIWVRSVVAVGLVTAVATWGRLITINDLNLLRAVRTI